MATAPRVTVVERTDVFFEVASDGVKPEYPSNGVTEVRLTLAAAFSLLYGLAEALDFSVEEGRG